MTNSPFNPDKKSTKEKAMASLNEILAGISKAKVRKPKIKIPLPMILIALAALAFIVVRTFSDTDTTTVTKETTTQATDTIPKSYGDDKPKRIKGSGKGSGKTRREKSTIKVAKGIIHDEFIKLCIESAEARKKEMLKGELPASLIEKLDFNQPVLQACYDRYASEYASYLIRNGTINWVLADSIAVNMMPSDLDRLFKQIVKID